MFLIRGFNCELQKLSNNTCYGWQQNINYQKGRPAWAKHGLFAGRIEFLIRLNFTHIICVVILISQKSFNLPVCHAFVVRRKTILQVRERKSIMIQFWNNKKAKEPQLEEISKQVVTKHLVYGPLSEVNGLLHPWRKFSISWHIPNVEGKLGSSR